MPGPRPGAVRIGTSGWVYAGWRGPFYPKDVKAADQLSFYASRFDSVEINGSFYRLPSEKAVRTWRETVPEGFCFAWKCPRFITHFRRLKDPAPHIALVFGRMAGLSNRGGPVLFQLPPNLKRDDARLATFLGHLPSDSRAVVEFRDASWYDDTVFDILARHGSALCLSDHAAAPAPWRLTADHVYIRAHGPGGRYHGNYSDEALRAWTSVIRGWRDDGRDVFCFFDNDIKSAAPHDADRLKHLLAES